MIVYRKTGSKIEMMVSLFSLYNYTSASVLIDASFERPASEVFPNRGNIYRFNAILDKVEDIFSKTYVSKAIIKLYSSVSPSSIEPLYR